MRKRAFSAMAGISVLFATGCATPPLTNREDRPSEVLVASEQIEGDFLIEQHIRFRWDQRSGSTRAVIQQLCGRLSVVLLTPLGSPGVIIRQQGTAVEIESRPGAALPFDPMLVLQDIHRSLFVPLIGPPLPEGRRSAPLRGGESVEEIWRDGRLVARIFQMAAGQPGLVRVSYPDGFSANPLPSALSIDGESLGYHLEITTLSSVTLDCSSAELLPDRPSH